jgi:hypothetical protein
VAGNGQADGSQRVAAAVAQADATEIIGTSLAVARAADRASGKSPL